MAVYVKVILLVVVVGERRHGQCLVSPARGDEVANQGNVARRTLGRQIREADHQSAEQNLWDEQHRDADIDGHDRAETLGQQQTGEVGQEGGDEEDEPPGGEQSVDAHHRIAYKDEQQRLHQREGCHEDYLRPDIAAVGQAQEALALQQGTVFDDFLGTTTHTGEGGHDDGHEEVADEVLVGHNAIALGRSKARQIAADQCQQGSLQEGNGHILRIGNLGADGAVQEDVELLERTRLLLVGSRNVADGHGLLTFLLLRLQVELVPLLWRGLALVREFAAAVEGFLVDDVEHNLRIDIAAGRTSAGLRISVVGCLLEIGDGIDGVTVEDGIATLVQQPQAVEELIDVARRLVDVDHDELALQRLLLQEVDDLLGIGR